MKKIYLSICFLAMTYMLSAQDVILKVNGDEIEATVQEVGLEIIKYKKAGEEAPIYSIAKSEVFMITYENGTKDWFGRRKKETQQTGYATTTNTTNTTAVSTIGATNTTNTTNTTAATNSTGTTNATGTTTNSATVAKQEKTIVRPVVIFNLSQIVPDIVWGF